MGHFKAFVLLPLGDADNIELSADLALEPYWMGRQVAPYQDTCGCTWNGKPNPDCDECNGTGLAWYTSPPKARWDWYTVEKTLTLPLQEELQTCPDAVIDVKGKWHEERTRAEVDPNWPQVVEILLRDHDGVAVIFRLPRLIHQIRRKLS